MAAKIDQKAYLKKYLSNDKKKKKKKHHSHSTKSSVTIIDDDVDISRMEKLCEADVDLFALGEEAPQVVGIIDDRPPELRAKEDFKNSSKWKVISTDDGFETNIKVQEISGNNDDTSPYRNLASSRLFGEDASPPRKSKPPPKRNDLSPPRTKPSSSQSLQYKAQARSPPNKDFNRDDSPKRPSHRKLPPDSSPPRIKQERIASPDLSPVRRQDFTTRKRNKEYSKSNQVKQERRSRSTDLSPRRKNSRRTPDSSPQRSRYRSPSKIRIKQERISMSPDISPQRRGRKTSDSPSRHYRRSPTQQTRIKQERSRTPDLSPRRSGQKSSRWNNSPRRICKSLTPDMAGDRTPEMLPTSKMTKTLDGKMAGLQNAKDLKVETEKFRKRENDVFDKMSVEVSGRYAETIVREKSGKRKDIEKEIREEFEKRKKDEKKKEIYTRWGKGVKQVEEYKSQLESDYHEMNKPLARYSDDADLDDYLKQQDRIGDPMLVYLRNKQKEKNKKAGIPEKPNYQGMFPDNRYNIRPGYRWDGVDRSNGYEKRWFEMISKKKAVAEEAYKYSVEDM